MLCIYLFTSAQLLKSKTFLAKQLKYIGRLSVTRLQATKESADISVIRLGRVQFCNLKFV